MTFSSSLLVCALLIPAQASGTEFVHNFRGSNMPSADKMTLAGIGPMVEVEPEEAGLRIKILANRGKDGAGMQTRFSLTGDFEITTSYEILSFDKPARGYGVGFFLTISPSAWKEKRAGLSRIWSVRNGSGFQPLILMSEPEPINKAAWEPSETMKGQLRMRREGAKLCYLVNDDFGKPFREIFQCEYGTDDIDAVRLVANPGNSPAAVDVRLLDVQMYWGALPKHAGTAPPLAAAPVGQVAEEHTDSKGSLAMTLIIGLAATLLVILAVAVFFYVRQGRRGQPG
jgi:hypothetical protein